MLYILFIFNKALIYLAVYIFVEKKSEAENFWFSQKTADANITKRRPTIKLCTAIITCPLISIKMHPSATEKSVVSCYFRFLWYIYSKLILE